MKGELASQTAFEGMPRASRMWSLTALVAMSMVLAACGGQSSADDEGSTTAPQEQAITTAAPDDTAGGPSSSTTAQQSDDGQQGSSGSSSKRYDFEGGSATLTIANETVIFDFFECFSDQAAVEFYGEDDATFVAVGQTETDAGLATLFLVSTDGSFGPNYTTFYSPNGSFEQAWQDVGGDAAFVVDGDQVSHEGDFSKIVDEVLTEEKDPGSLTATCG